MVEERNALAVERGRRLRELRLAKGLTQTQVAEHVDGWNRARLAGYETGIYDLSNATFGSILQLAKALGVAVSKLAKIM